MALELKDVVGRYELLERESQATTTDLEKALQMAKETRCEIRAARCQDPDPKSHRSSM